MGAKYKHIVVVHGIGEQVPNETAVNFINELIRALPLSDFCIDVGSLIELSSEATRGAGQRQDHVKNLFQPASFRVTDKRGGQEYVIDFSEVYWQYLVVEYLKSHENLLPMPFFTWAHSLSNRFRQGDTKNYRIARSILDNLETMFMLLDKLAVILKQAKIFERITLRFVGNVQMYAEDQVVREQVDQRFLRILGEIPKFAQQEGCDDYEIYIVAHSEGTVIAYRNLIRAAGKGLEWMRHVKGLATLGSPLEKHFRIWPNVFNAHALPAETTEVEKTGRIRWMNYFDRSDPVGSGLKVLFEEEGSDGSRLFEVVEDRGFSRYAIPGLAHVGYWKDQGILQRIALTMMGLDSKAKPSLHDKYPFAVQWLGDRFLYFAVRFLTAMVLVFFVLKLGDGAWQAYHYLTATMGKQDPSGHLMEMKDWAGCLTGIVVAVLVWMLHTTVHRGLIQMWRHTLGNKSTFQEPAKRPKHPKPPKQEAVAAE
jgi:hypothetical protein